MYFPVVPFLENKLPILVPDFQLEILPKKEMGYKHGETRPSEKQIRIREDVYLGAVAGHGRDRMTIAHEIGHLFLHANDSISLCKLAPNEKLRAFEDDYRFEDVYAHPMRTLDKYAQYSFLLTPDFSTYADMNLWRQLESVAKKPLGRGILAEQRFNRYPYN